MLGPRSRLWGLTLRVLGRFRKGERWRRDGMDVMWLVVVNGWRDEGVLGG